jgi:hypothetical protein
MAWVVTKTRRTLQDRFLRSSINCIDIHNSHLVELDSETAAKHKQIEVIHCL